MTIAFDQHSINDMTVAISREMSPRGARRPAQGDTLFMGGARPSGQDKHALADFGQRKNWKIVFPCFDPANAGEGPTGFHVVVTDGLTQTIILSDGRLWKRDRSTPAVLLFADIQAVVRINGQGRLTVAEMRDRYHDHGFDMALGAVRARAARKPGKAPVVSPIGSLMTVLDMRAMADMFAAA